MRDDKQHDAWLVVDGELCDSISERWLREQKPAVIFRIAVETYRKIAKYDSGDHLAWYSLGAFEGIGDGGFTEVDQVQDYIEVQHLTRGVALLHELWPITTRRARRAADRESFSGK